MATAADWKSAIQQVGNLRYKNLDVPGAGHYLVVAFPFLILILIVIVIPFLYDGDYEQD
jgi:hypothetical protein